MLAHKARACPHTLVEGMPEEGGKVRVVVGWARRLLHASRDMLGVSPNAFYF